MICIRNFVSRSSSSSSTTTGRSVHSHFSTGANDDSGTWGNPMDQATWDLIDNFLREETPTYPGRKLRTAR